MLRTIKLGKGEHGTFALPADAATQTYAFIARRGAGKTYAAGVLVEGIAVNGGSMAKEILFG